MDALINGTLSADKEVREMEVLVCVIVVVGVIGVLLVVVAVVVTAGLKSCEGDEAGSVVAEAKVEFAAIVLASEVVTLATDTSVDTGVVDLRNGGPGVEREVVEDTLSGGKVLEGIGLVVVVA